MTTYAHRLFLVPAATLLACLFAEPAARASDALRQELAVVAKNLANLLKGQDEDSIAVGHFAGPSHYPASSGPLIVKTLCEELKKLQVIINSKAKLEVKGDFIDVTDKETKLLVVRIKGRVLSRSGDSITEFDRSVFGSSAVAILLGLTAQLPASADAKVRSDVLKASIDHPRAHLAGARIAAGPGSPYAVEILVRPAGGKYARRPAKSDNGIAFVPIQHDEVYAVRLINDSPFEAAVQLSVDGLSMFSFSEVKDKAGQPRYSRIIIDPKSSVVIRGWHVTNQRSDEFLVTEYAKSAAAELKATGSIGTITAVFSASWPKGSEPPADELSRAGTGTGRGQRFAAKFNEVERTFGAVRGTVSVRYAK